MLVSDFIACYPHQNTLMATLRSLTILPRSLASSSSLRYTAGAVTPIRHYVAPKKPAPKPPATPRPISKSKQAFMLPGQVAASRRDQRRAQVGAVNMDIPFAEVHVVDSETENLGPIQPLKDVVDSISQDTHAVRLVRLDPPVVRIIDLEGEKVKERERFARQKLSRRLAVEDKEIQVGWHSAQADMQHKAKMARQALEKGDRVHVIFATRVGGTQSMVSAQKKAEVVALFDEALEEVGDKWKDDERVKGLWVLYYQPKAQIREAAKERLVEKESKKKAKHDVEKEARRKKQQERERKAHERLKEDLAEDPWA